MKRNYFIELLERRLISIANDLEMSNISYGEAKDLLINDFMLYDDKIENKEGID